MNNTYTGKDWSEVEELAILEGATRITPLGVKVMPPQTRVYSSLKPRTKAEKICSVLVTNTQELCPIGEIAFYQPKVARGGVVVRHLCTVLDYNDKKCKATIMLGDTKKTVGQEFIRPLTVNKR